MVLGPCEGPEPNSRAHLCFHRSYWIWGDLGRINIPQCFSNIFSLCDASILACCFHIVLLSSLCLVLKAYWAGTLPLSFLTGCTHRQGLANGNALPVEIFSQGFCPSGPGQLGLTWVLPGNPSLGSWLAPTCLAWNFYSLFQHFLSWAGLLWDNCECHSEKVKAKVAIRWLNWKVFFKTQFTTVPNHIYTTPVLHSHSQIPSSPGSNFSP